ncbi:MAG: protein translocase SEC61 complex subunit gamma [archaeon GB-1867-097]|nr:protein translocase SEC61 complex subunit gamma [Candidatus Culexmicrobium thermophilum]
MKDLGGFKDQIKRVIHLSRKPSTKEFLLSLRICFIGLMVLGAYGFIIQLLSTVIQALPT